MEYVGMMLSQASECCQWSGAKKQVRIFIKHSQGNWLFRNSNVRFQVYGNVKRLGSFVQTIQLVVICCQRSYMNLRYTYSFSLKQVGDGTGCPCK